MQVLRRLLQLKAKTEAGGLVGTEDTIAPVLPLSKPFEAVPGVARDEGRGRRGRREAGREQRRIDALLERGRPGRLPDQLIKQNLSAMSQQTAGLAQLPSPRARCLGGLLAGLWAGLGTAPGAGLGAWGQAGATGSGHALGGRRDQTVNLRRPLPGSIELRRGRFAFAVRRRRPTIAQYRQVLIPQQSLLQLLGEPIPEQKIAARLQVVGVKRCQIMQIAELLERMFQRERVDVPRL